MTTANSRPFTEAETPGRKRSAPIAIELPCRSPTAVYTPLSARGDLPGYVLNPEFHHIGNKDPKLRWVFDVDRTVVCGVAGWAVELG